MMGFRRSDLQEAFFVAGTHGFRVWGYGTIDPLDEVLKQDYFQAARGILCPGELIYVSTQPEIQTGGPEGATSVALVMVRRGERGATSVRLVQEFGGPDVASTSLPVASVKRGRGRPPGSRNKNPE